VLCALQPGGLLDAKSTATLSGVAQDLPLGTTHTSLAPSRRAALHIDGAVASREYQAVGTEEANPGDHRPPPDCFTMTSMLS
jgi:hypothetical protein